MISNILRHLFPAILLLIWGFGTMTFSNVFPQKCGYQQLSNICMNKMLSTKYKYA